MFPAEAEAFTGSLMEGWGAVLPDSVPNHDSTPKGAPRPMLPAPATRVTGLCCPTLDSSQFALKPGLSFPLEVTLCFHSSSRSRFLFFIRPSSQYKFQKQESSSSTFFLFK